MANGNYTTNPKALDLSNLEFEGIKSNIKEFLKGQDEFLTTTLTALV